MVKRTMAILQHYLHGAFCDIGPQRVKQFNWPNRESYQHIESVATGVKITDSHHYGGETFQFILTLFC